MSFSEKQDRINDAAMMDALEGVTRYALIEAARAIRRGSLGHTFFPSPVELRLECDKAQRPVDNMARRVHLTEAQMRERQEEERFQRQKTPEARARVAALVERFRAGYDTDKQSTEEAERAEIRARYGMTDELIEKIKDQPIPSNFKKLA